MEKIQINLPDGVRYIINKLEINGYTAYAVGGCIRDSLLGKTPHDWDITTSAEPKEVMDIFKKNRAIPTGLQHGTITVVIDNEAYEVTTYRIDGTYLDGRRPENVIFTQTIEDDLSRRDFTINAMAYNDKDGLIDCFGGVNDLNNKLIRCVGEAEQRFSEDYLRMLRAYRFAGVLGFTLDNSIIKACENNSKNLLNISVERIRIEFDKLLLSSNFNVIELFFNTFCEILFPDIYNLKDVFQINKFHCYDVYQHTMKVLENTPEDLEIRLTALFHDTGKKYTRTTDDNGVDHFFNHPEISTDITCNVLKHYKYDNNTTKNVVALVDTHNNKIIPNKKVIKKFINQIGKENTYKAITFQICDTMGKSDLAISEKYETLKKCFDVYNEILANNEPCSIKDLAIKGSHVMELLNVKSGKEVGEALNFLLDAVILKPEINNFEDLSRLVVSNFKK